jgi:tetratricopeptide (TPR) repeat protein
VLFTDLDMDRYHAELRCEVGMAFADEGLLDRAESEFEAALGYVEGYPDALFGLGTIYAARGSLEEAEEKFLEFMEAEPDDSRGPLELSRLYLATGDGTGALDLASWALDLSPDEPVIWMQMARSAVAAGDTTLAVTWLVRTISGDPDLEPEARVFLAGIRRNGGFDSEARELLLPAVADGYPPALWMLARIYLDWGDHMRAVDTIRRYLAAAPCGEMADSALLVLEDLAESGDYIPPDSP